MITFNLLAGIASVLVLFMQTSQPKGAAIEGLVVTMGTLRPVPGAQVTLFISNQPGSIVFQPLKPGGGQRVAFTDREGHFVFENLTPGGYQFEVVGNGFVRKAYGSGSHNERGRTFNLAAGQRMKDVVV